ncbi:hypothetical protein AB9P05_12990 [Roseivirga sp. BDSF3-8]|uniref:hypothetical protein n=1 Tax=Roseivirga sp. BDSF3-8 TaxID=3241598 RepID=UPI0035322698
MTTIIKVILKRIFLPGITATTAMTAFSYGASYVRKNTFKEPEHLNRLFVHPRQKKVNRPPIVGFLLHYFVGVWFSALYHSLWRRIKSPSWTGGVAFGGLCGLLGAGVWKVTFAAHPKPPRINLSSYLLHIVIAHIIFGMFLEKTDRLVGKKGGNMPYEQAD